MKIKGKFKIILPVVLILLVAVCIYWIIGQKPHRTAPPEYVFTYAENQAEDYPTTEGGKRFAELVAERTEGRIQILVKSGAVLGSETEVINQMRYGGIDFARVSLAQVADAVPKMNVLQMPYLYQDSEHMWRVLEGQLGDEFLAETRQIDLIGLSWYDAGARNFYSTDKPITSLADMQGMRVRVQESDTMKDIVEALGATAVPITYADVYSAMERGVVEGAENNWPSYESTTHYEVAPYYTIDEHSRIPELQLCSRFTWEKLSAEDQEILRVCARESALYERELWKEREERSREIAVANGTVVVELSQEEKRKFQAAMQGVYEKYCGEYLDIIEEIREY